MIIDLDQGMFVVDNQSRPHKVLFIDFSTKIVYVEKEAYNTNDESLLLTINCTKDLDSQQQEVINTNSKKLLNNLYTVPNAQPESVGFTVVPYKYGTHDLTVITKEVNLNDDEFNTTSLI